MPCLIINNYHTGNDKRQRCNCFASPGQHNPYKEVTILEDVFRDKSFNARLARLFPLLSIFMIGFVLFVSSQANAFTMNAFTTTTVGSAPFGITAGPDSNIIVYAEDVSDDLTQGIAQYEKGNFHEAIKDLKLVVQQFKERPEDQDRNQRLFQANLYLGLAYFGIGQKSLAKEAFRGAVLAVPGKNLDPELFSPKVISLYNEVTDKILSNLSIESNVPGAEVFLNNDKKGKAPIHIRNLVPGEYAVEVIIGNQKAVKKVILEAGKGATLVADFTNLGFLSVTSEPSAATVSLDNMESGTTPFTKQVPSGEYTVVVSKEGYKELQKRVIVKDNETEKMHIVLPPSTCSVRIFSEPGSADVYLDGIHKGTTPFLMNDVAGGTHLIKIEKEGYQKIQETLNANQALVEKTYKLLPITGGLSIQTDPDGAEVLIDGKDAGSTPLQLSGLMEKKYLVHLEKKGYTSKSLMVNIQADKITQIKETLLQSQPPTITFAPLEKVVKENKNYVKARVKDNEEVGDVLFIFTFGDWRYANRVKMEENTKGVFEALIPDTVLQKTTMKYYISACDIHNNCSTKGSQDSPFIIKVTSFEPYTEGYILDILRDRGYHVAKLTISLGVEDGVRKGDHYVVFRTGQHLRDPVTGEILQIEEILVGTIEVTELMPRTSCAEVDDNFQPIQENDRIRKVVSAPKGVTTEAVSDGEIKVKWYPNTEPEVKGYKIFRSSQLSGTYKRIGSVRGRDNMSYKDDEDISPGVTYYYRITAYNILDNDSEMSEPAAGTAKKVR
jgi:PEGA domain-containing protein